MSGPVSMQDAELCSSTIPAEAGFLDSSIYHTDVASKTMEMEHAGNIKSKISKRRKVSVKVRDAEFRIKLKGIRSSSFPSAPMVGRGCIVAKRRLR